MDSHKEDKLGMFLKSDSFLFDRAAVLSINMAFVAIKTQVENLINEVIQADSTATRNLKGLTIDKGDKSTTLKTAVLTIAAACRGYYTANPDPFKKKLVQFTASDIIRNADTEIISTADKVHDVAEPIKSLLGPWGVDSIDVDSLLLKVDEYRPTIVKRSREQDISAVANKQIETLYAAIDKLLEDCDDHMAVYEFTNNPLYLEYKLARAIDDSGGGSGTAGYDVETFVIPAGGTLQLPFGGPGTIPSTFDIYMRALNGTVTVCTTNLPPEACTGGYVLATGVTFKGAISGMSLDLGKSHIQLHNPGSSAVSVRAGVKTV